MTILDTNVLSALMHVAPDKNVVAWLDRQPRASIWITSITVLEIRFGLQIMPGGKRRSALIQSFQELLDKIDHHVVPFDVAAAEEAADLVASRQRSGRPGDLRDTMIAGIVIAQHATLATRNTAHFEDIAVPLVDPWTH
ncbi:MAG TPA: type II toxin-antitoxin system VapC family toxin [Verrucomicrobiae bacterium]|jgi:predicted nucleic acid-binding protein|nr:type II toxin-antitoxin system VapC family toxin [Verrucomicrobiae bacterium]